MLVYNKLIIDEFDDFGAKFSKVISSRDNFVLLNSNNYLGDSHGEYDLMAGVGIASEMLYDGDEFGRFKDFTSENRDWQFCLLSYDLKNSIENLSSENFDGIDFPLIKVFKPEVLMLLKDRLLTVYIAEETYPNSKFMAEDIIHEINILNDDFIEERHDFEVHQRMSRHEYLTQFYKIKKHIAEGDIYEVNLCQEFYVNDYNCNPSQLYQRLCKFSPSPFSAFCRFGEKYIFSSSPERFLKKSANKILSQPMKGTSRRFDDQVLDQKAINELQSSDKERSENIMIVDLVRNDLSKSAVKGTVKVDELCGVYSFKHVHQMISTVSCVVEPNAHPVEIIKNCFPMGSMTGAPKIRAMQIIEDCEHTRRGIYSGAVGYMKPNGDFDFNVVIRSLIYNKSDRYLSIITGGAITSLSVGENEYDETMLKAEALIKVL